MIFVFDIDDTISETDKYSTEYILNYFEKCNLPYKQIQRVSRFAEAKFDWDVKTALKWYKKYGDEMMLNFPCKPHALEVIQQLKADGHKIILATARANDWHTDPEKCTLEWLKKVGLPYDKIYIGRIDKEKICLDEKADFFVDDDISMITKITADCHDTKALLLNTDYNLTKEVPHEIIRIDNFLDLQHIAN